MRVPSPRSPRLQRRRRSLALARTGAFLLLLSLAGCAPAGPADDGVLVAHRFDASAEGWQVASDTGLVDPAFQPDGGNPGGYITGEDEALGETWYFRAPASVLERLPAAEGGVLRYSLKQSSSAAGFLDDDIVIQGPAGRLSYRFRTAPGTEWTDFTVPLSAAAGWRWNWNRSATEEQVRSVLRNPARLDIRGEFQTGEDVGSLDTFELTAGP